MSRYYGMNVSISEHVPDKAEAIKRAAAKEWDFHDWTDTEEGAISSYADGRLCGGETEEE